MRRKRTSLILGYFKDNRLGRRGGLVKEREEGVVREVGEKLKGWCFRS